MLQDREPAAEMAFEGVAPVRLCVMHAHPGTAASRDDRGRYPRSRPRRRGVEARRHQLLSAALLWCLQTAQPLEASPPGAFSTEAARVEQDLPPAVAGPAAGIAVASSSGRWKSREHRDRRGTRLARRNATPAPLTTGQGAAASDTPRLQVVTDELRTRLSIADAVTVRLVDELPLLFSVERNGSEGFLLKIDRAFLDQLTDIEVRAAIAHELGHVWIFTHHPYLHTEALANSIAMRAVSRDALARVYQRMWARQGVEGDLIRVIGEPTIPPVASTRTVGFESSDADTGPTTDNLTPSR